MNEKHKKMVTLLTLYVYLGTYLALSTGSTPTVGSSNIRS